MNAANVSTQSPLPVVLVTGFLGAGKTTLMRRLILDAAARGLKASVVVNEFGVADVDGHILSEAGAELLSSVAGGCACCTGQEEFLWTMLQLAERQGEARPDVVLVEASGLADPLLMLDCLSVAHLLPRLRPAALIAVVDQSRFHLMRDEVAPLLIRQLKLADLIVLNKIDISFAPRKERTPPEELALQLHEINAKATIIPARACEFPLDELWCKALNSCFHETTESSQRAEEAGHAHYHTVTVPLHQTVEKSWLEERVARLDSSIWRVKGFARIQTVLGAELHLLQYTGGIEPLLRIEPFPLPEGLQKIIAASATLVFIGPQLDPAQLQKEFNPPQRLSLNVLNTAYEF